MSVQVSYRKTLKNDLAPFYAEARSKECKEWQTLLDMNAFEIIDRPPGATPIPSHFCYSLGVVY
jgi:hypothetical protein